MLRELREQRGLSQRRLAKEVGIGVKTVREIELGVADPRIGTYERLVKALKCDLEVLDNEQ